MQHQMTTMTKSKVKSLPGLPYLRHQMITVTVHASDDGDRYGGDDQYDVVQGQVLGRVAVSASSDDDQPHLLNSDSVRSDRIFSTFDKVRGRYCKAGVWEEEQTDISKEEKSGKDISCSCQKRARNIT